MKRSVIFSSVATMLVLVAIGIAIQRRGRIVRPALEDTTGVIEHQQRAQDSPVQTMVTASGDAAWDRFRGPNGTGVSDDQTIPTTWNDDQNLAWKTKLPGAGASSPVLTDQYVLLTSYSGYGDPETRAGDVDQLQRHVTCVDRRDGNTVWSKTIDSLHREDPYQGMGLPEHGYSTNSCVTDGKIVFAFLGRSGVHAFDIDGGNSLWQTSVGTQSGNRGWGSAASLMLYGDLVIVNASEESQSIQALRKSTGEVVWKAEAASLELSYGTPAIVTLDNGVDELVIAVPGEIWGLNPLTGKLIWYIETSLTDNLSPSIIVDATTIFAFGGYRSSGSVAVKAGGKGDATETNVIWTSRNSSYVATPVLVDRALYWIDDRGLFFAADADTGETITKKRMPTNLAGQRPVYASPIAIHGLVYAQTRQSGVFVMEPGDELKIISQNNFDSDPSVFNATPAVDAGQLFLRSDRYLYCVMAGPT